MKLFLDPTKKLPAFAPSAESAKLLKRYDRNVTDVTTDFLTQLYRHTIQALRIRYGNTSMLQTAVQFVLTVPASWSDAAKYSILNAADKSGLGSRRELQLITEPEAAALHALNSTGSELQNAGDTFIVCDAGGASVDVVAYRIKQICPLKIEEATVSSSAMCGSAELNHRFEQYMMERMGDAMFRGLKEKMPQSWRMCARHFEDVVKKDFREDDPLDAFLPLPGMYVQLGPRTPETNIKTRHRRRCAVWPPQWLPSCNPCRAERHIRSCCRRHHSTRGSTGQTNPSQRR